MTANISITKFISILKIDITYILLLISSVVTVVFEVYNLDISILL